MNGQLHLRNAAPAICVREKAARRALYSNVLTKRDGARTSCLVSEGRCRLSCGSACCRTHRAHSRVAQWLFNELAGRPVRPVWPHSCTNGLTTTPVECYKCNYTYLRFSFVGWAPPVNQYLYRGIALTLLLTQSFFLFVDCGSEPPPWALFSITPWSLGESC